MPAPFPSWFSRLSLALALAGCAPAATTEVAGMTPGASERGNGVNALAFPRATTSVKVEAGASPELLHVDREGHLWVRQDGGTQLVKFGADGAQSARYALGPDGPGILVFPPSGLPRGLAEAANAPDSGVLRPGWSKAEPATYRAWSRMTDAGRFEPTTYLETPMQVQRDGQGGLWVLWDQPDALSGALDLWMARLAPDGSATAVRKVRLDGLARTGYAPIGGDRSGHLWLVYRFEDGHKIERFTPDGKRSGVLGYGSELRSISSAVEDGEGNIWLHYRGGSKLIVIRPNGQRIGLVAPEFGPASIQSSAGAAVWAYTLGRPRENGSLVKYAKDGQGSDKITSPYEDYGFLGWAAGPDGTLWVHDKPAGQLIRMGP